MGYIHSIYLLCVMSIYTFGVNAFLSHICGSKHGKNAYGICAHLRYFLARTCHAHAQIYRFICINKIVVFRGIMVLCHRPRKALLSYWLLLCAPYKLSLCTRTHAHIFIKVRTHISSSHIKIVIWGVCQVLWKHTYVGLSVTFEASILKKAVKITTGNEGWAVWHLPFLGFLRATVGQILKLIYRWKDIVTFASSTLCLWWNGLW